MLESPELIVFKILNKPLQSGQQLFLNTFQPEKHFGTKVKNITVRKEYGENVLSLALFIVPHIDFSSQFCYS